MRGIGANDVGRFDRDYALRFPIEKKSTDCDRADHDRVDQLTRPALAFKAHRRGFAVDAKLRKILLVQEISYCEGVTVRVAANVNRTNIDVVSSSIAWCREGESNPHGVTTAGF